MPNFEQPNDFIFNYHMLSDNTKNLVIDDVPTMSGINKIVVNGKNIAVYSSVDFIKDFFKKSIENIAVDDVLDYVYYGIVDVLYDSLAEHKIAASDIQFDGTYRLGIRL